MKTSAADQVTLAIAEAIVQRREFTLLTANEPAMRLVAGGEV